MRLLIRRKEPGRGEKEAEKRRRTVDPRSLEVNVGAAAPRLLMGPGPSNVAPEVLAAQARPTIGHLDASFVGLMDLIKDSRTYFASFSAQTTA
nr:hypothetical protein [Ensifer aridi]